MYSVDVAVVLPTHSRFIKFPYSTIDAIEAANLRGLQFGTRTAAFGTYFDFPFSIRIEVRQVYRSTIISTFPCISPYRSANIFPVDWLVNKKTNTRIKILEQSMLMKPDANEKPPNRQTQHMNAQASPPHKMSGVMNLHVLVKSARRSYVQWRFKICGCRTYLTLEGMSPAATLLANSPMVTNETNAKVFILWGKRRIRFRS